MRTGLVHGGSWSRHLRSNIVVVVFEGAVAALFQAFFRNGQPHYKATCQSPAAFAACYTPRCLSVRRTFHLPSWSFGNKYAYLQASEPMTIPGTHNGLLSMPPNSQPTNATHGGTAASQPLAAIKTNENGPARRNISRNEGRRCRNMVYFG